MSVWGISNTWIGSDQISPCSSLNDKSSEMGYRADPIWSDPGFVNSRMFGVVGSILILTLWTMSFEHNKRNRYSKNYEENRLNCAPEGQNVENHNDIIHNNKTLKIFVSISYNLFIMCHSAEKNWKMKCYEVVCGVRANVTSDPISHSPCHSKVYTRFNNGMKI